MPTGGSSGEFYALSNAVATANNNLAYQNFQFDSPFRGVFAGYRYSSYWSDQGNWGGIWSASHNPDYSDYASALRFDWGYVNPGDDWERDDGLSVRCLLQ
jgi:hypothetical protein